MMQERLESARRELASVVQGMAGTVPVEMRVETGDVAAELAKVAASYTSSSPMLVLGRRAGGSRGSAPGAIAYRVLSEASMPVLVYLGSR
jgi:nucleotide-binding universal stress UspA family protein